VISKQYVRTGPWRRIVDMEVELKVFFILAQDELQAPAVCILRNENLMLTGYVSTRQTIHHAVSSFHIIIFSNQREN
jgi:hypothetical protein